MRNKLKAFKWTSLIEQLYWTAIFGIPAMVYGINHVVDVFIRKQNNNEAVFADLVFLAIIIFLASINLVFNIINLILYFKNKSKAKELKNYKKLNFDCTREYESLEMHFKNRSDIEYISEIHYVCNNNNIDEFKHSLRWSGTEIIDCSIDSSLDYEGNIHTIEKRKENNMHLEFIVKSKNKRQCNDCGKYRFVLRLRDGEQNGEGKFIDCIMTPVSSRVVNWQTKHLVLRVSAPPDLIKNVKTVSYYGNALLDDPTSAEMKRIAGCECYEWDITNPALLSTCKLEWEFV